MTENIKGKKVKERKNAHVNAQVISDKEILELHSLNLTNLEIARKLGITQAGVSYRVKALELKNNHWKRITGEKKVHIKCPHCGHELTF